jgi:membrane-associated protease RseP (regulator of RpoE activity)
MINLDMVGRLRDDRVTIYGVRSAAPFAPIVADGARQLALQTNLPDGVGPSDHLSFYNKQIPVLHFFTGSHTDYHRPGDTWDKLNYPGMAQISDLVLSCALAIAALPQAPLFVALPSRSPSQTASERPGTRVYLGIIPEYNRTVDGVLLAGVAAASPAAAAGLREGDVIVQLANKKISNIEDLTDALGSIEPAAAVTILVQRGDRITSVTATLQPRG